MLPYLLRRAYRRGDYLFSWILYRQRSLLAARFWCSALPLGLGDDDAMRKKPGKLTRSAN
jgi:hypothetical protein